MSTTTHPNTSNDQQIATAALQGLQALQDRIAEAQKQFTETDLLSFLVHTGGGRSMSGLQLLSQLRAAEGRPEYRRKFYGRRTITPAITPTSSDQDKKDRQAREIEQLREQVKELTIQNQLLQTRVVEQAKSVAEQRNSLSRETRNSDKLHAELFASREQNAKLLDMQDRCVSFLNDRARANDSLVTQMACVANGQIRMHESYEGQVEHVGETTAIVVYNVNGDLVEQTYEKSQFKDGKLPAEGVCVKVLVFVVEYEPKPLSADDLERATSDKPSHRKPLSGPDRL